jgi:hypothetical protein
MAKDWLQIHDFDPSSWDEFYNVEIWWTYVALAHDGQRKAMGTILILVAWEIWSERNARTFKNVSTMATIVFHRIKSKLRQGLLLVPNTWVCSWRVCKPIFLGVVVKLNLDRQTLLLY